MLKKRHKWGATAWLMATVLTACVQADSRDGAKADRGARAHQHDDDAQLGSRPFYLIDGMDEGPLKEKLQGCKRGPFYRTNFSIAHRGAPLQFPEHTREGYEAAARQGAGIVECDTTFTADGELVCRHSECDLHTTTNIVITPLNAMCTTPWRGPGSTPKLSAAPATSRWNSSGRSPARWMRTIRTQRPLKLISRAPQAGAPISTPVAAR